MMCLTGIHWLVGVTSHFIKDTANVLMSACTMLQYEMSAIKCVFFYLIG